MKRIESTRIRELDLLRGIAITCVILGHSFITNPINIHDLPWGISLRHWIYTFHMELFFVLAGCVYHFSNYCTFIRKKVQRILVPYLIFGFFTILLFSIGLKTVNTNTTIGDGLIKLLLFGGNYWFLYVIFIIFAIYPAIEYLLNKWYFQVIFAAICLSVGFIPITTDYFKIGSVLYHLPFFIFGHLIVSKIPNLRNLNVTYKLCIVFTSLIAYIIFDNFLGDTGGNFLRFIKAILMITVLFYITVCMVNFSTKSTIMNRVNNFLSVCSTYSLQIYLFNGFISVPIRILLCNYFHITNPVCIVLLIVVCNLLFSILLCKYIINSSILLSYICGIPNKKY